MSNLLDKASIILTPTAYNNGEALCVKPSDGSGDFDFSRNSAATRVNAQGLVENVQILSSNLVQNGDFSEEGAEQITNGDFSNGSADWNNEGVWTIENGVANGNGANGASKELTQFITPLVIGKTYKIVYDVLNYVSGSVLFVLSGDTGTSGIARNSNGTYTEYVSPLGANSNFKIRGSVFNGSITNISVKEVGQNWNLVSANASIGENKLIANSVVTENIATQSGVVPISKPIILKFDLILNSGGFRVLAGSGGTATNITTSGTYTLYETSGTGGTLTLQSRFGSFDGSVTNLSIIEITTDTNLPRINYEGFSFDGSGNIIPNSGCGSWLWEPQSTQLLTYSELFSNSYWQNFGVGTTPILETGFLAPDGTNNAFKISNANQDSFLAASANVVNSNSTRSIYARTVSGTGTAQLLSHNSNTNNIFTITEQWQRFEVNTTTTGTGATTFYAVEFRGSGTLSEVIIWGANATNDQDYATSYIPSNGSSVTRNQDVCNNGGSLATINSTEGVLYAEIAALTDGGTFRAISLNDGTTNNNNVIRIYCASTDNRITIIIRSNGNLVLNYNHTLTSIIDFNKIAIKYKQNDFSLWVNGVNIHTETTGNTPIGLNELVFNNGLGTELFFGKTKALAVFPYLTDSELTALTTI